LAQKNIPNMLYNYSISSCTTWRWPTSVAETFSCGYCSR